MNIIKNKRAISHIEIVLSFVIFAGFLVFLLAIFNPFQVVDNNTNSIDKLERVITNYLSTDLSLVSFNTSKHDDKTCFEVEENYDFSNVIVKNQAKDVIKATKHENKIDVEYSGTFYTIYSNPDFSENSLLTNDCKTIDLTKGEGIFGILRTVKASSYTNLTKFNQTYYNNYGSLKSSLQISKDFSFSVRDSSSNTLMKGERKTMSNRIASRDIPIELVYSNGDIKLAILNIKTWS